MTNFGFKESLTKFTSETNGEASEFDFFVTKTNNQHSILSRQCTHRRWKLMQGGCSCITITRIHITNHDKRGTMIKVMGIIKILELEV
jgi:hypothetical protein